MSAWEQVQALLKSRKFWAMVTAIVAAVAALAINQIDTWQFIIAVVASMAAFSTGVAIEDAGQKMGQGMKSLSPPNPAPEVLKDLNPVSDQPANKPRRIRGAGDFHG